MIGARRGDKRWTRIIVVDCTGAQVAGAYKKRETAARHLDRLNASPLDWHQWNAPYRIVELQPPTDAPVPDAPSGRAVPEAMPLLYDCELCGFLHSDPAREPLLTGDTEEECREQWLAYLAALPEYTEGA